MPLPPVRSPRPSNRVVAAVNGLLRRLRNLLTQRVENELRHEIALLHEALLPLRERLQVLEIVAASGHAWPARAELPGSRVPRFSVILATRDRGALLGAAIESVQRQSFLDWELLIVDDGSTDDTVERVAPYLSDPRIRYLHEAAAGVAQARNTALVQARGELVAYLDSDNAWLPNFLAGMAAEFQADAGLDSAYAILLDDAASHAGSHVLWQPFDTGTLLHGNYIDLNVYVHRRALLQRFGPFDPTLTRLSDWDLILRYTRHGGCRRVPVAGAFYRSNIPERISTTRSYGDNRFRVLRKHRALASPARPLRVLYAMWHYPQLSETYVETEIRAMLRLGVTIEVWSSDDVATPYEPAVKFHRGELAAAIATFGPDLVHVHWLTSAITYGAVAAAAGVPFTARAHGFEVTPQTLAALLAMPRLGHVFLFPAQRALAPPGDPRIAPVASAFDTELFYPAPKQSRLIVRTAAALPSKDLVLFLRAAKRLPLYRFVLICVTAFRREAYVDELIRLKAELESPAELHFDLPHARTAEYVRAAGIYLHTAAAAGEADATPIGMPISIAEAMATGAYVLVREDAALREYIGDAGAVYRDLDEAVAQIDATASWDARQWQRARNRAIDRAYAAHADDAALLPIHTAWTALVGTDTTR